MEKLIFEKSKAGKRAAIFDVKGHRADEFLSADLMRQEVAKLPEVSEPEIVRHFVRLSQKNFCVDTNFYPLGSCTMKYNPKINDFVTRDERLATIHPYQPIETAQVIMQMLYDLEQYLCSVTGMKRFTLQPAAGAHGELAGMMMVKAYFENKGDKKRKKVIVPDGSHGTNPASAAEYGFEVVQIPSNERGIVNLQALKEAVNEETACIMLTNPNTLGVFEEDIQEIASIMHKAGALLYYDGANMNALLGLVRPSDMGFDIVHLNLHKTFSVPHGGGGPGAGPVGVSERLVEYLPVPLLKSIGDQIVFDWNVKHSIGRLKSFYGQAAALIRAWVYIRCLGRSGLKQVSEDAIINANYLKKKLEKYYLPATKGYCMHEFVLDLAKEAKDRNIHAIDLGKRLLDFGFHAPTVHFPLIIREAVMIEPTESESKETLDEFVEAMIAIAEEINNNPEIVRTAPHTMTVKRCDDVLAARKPDLNYFAEKQAKPSESITAS